MKRTTKIALVMSVMFAVGFGIGAGREIAALAERKQSAVTDRGTVYEYQTGSMTLVQNAYGGSIFADFDASTSTPSPMRAATRSSRPNTRTP